MENPDVTLQINSLTTYYRGATTTGTGSGSSSGSIKAEAINDATNIAYNRAIGNTGYASPSDGGEIYNTNSFGFVVDSVVRGSASGSVRQVDDGTGEKEWYASATASASRRTRGYQLKVNFTIPAGLTSNSIESAYFKFYITQFSQRNSDNYAVCAPTTIEQSCYKKYSTASDVIDTSIQSVFTVTQDNIEYDLNNKLYSEVNITNVLKRCVEINQGWFTILVPADKKTSNQYIIVDETEGPIIEIEYSYTNVTAPTSFSSQSTIKAPGSTFSVQWSGASAGTNNLITGYKIYYCVSDLATNPTLNDSVILDEYENPKLFTSTSANITLPIDAVRKKYYNYAVQTIGTASNFDSVTLSPTVSIKINSLPEPPQITSTTGNKVPSQGGNITFTTVPGSDNEDPGQNRTVYYSTTSSGNKISVTDSTVTFEGITETTDYYFWTFDGEEYSGYNQQTVTLNTPPSIGYITMIAVNTFSPNITVSSYTRDYVKNINGTATNVNGNNLTYQWALCISDSADSSSFNTEVPISTATSLSNIDVTAYGADFNTAYKLKLTVRDGVESAEAVSSQIFCIPPAPTIQIYNQNGEGNLDGTDYRYFGRYIRIRYNVLNTGVTKKLQYKLSSASTWMDLNLTGTNNYNDVDLNALARNNLYNPYNFQVVFTCNTKTFTTPSVNAEEGHETTRTILTRAEDITPKNIQITAQNISGKIKPYTDSAFTVQFTGPTKVTEGNYSSIYTTTSIEYEGRSQNITSAFSSNTNNTITTTWSLSNITTTNWITLINGSNSSSAPNASYSNPNIKIIATNEFGETFTNTQPIALNFVEGVSSVGTAILKIKTGENPDSYTDIPIPNPRPTSSSPLSDYYPIFEGQTLQVSVSDIKCYANQKAKIYLVSEDNDLASVDILESNWTKEDTGYLYKLEGSKEIIYEVPSNYSDDGDKKIDFTVKIVLENKEVGLNINDLQNICAHVKFNPGGISLSIKSASCEAVVNQNEEQYTVTCEYGSLGGGSDIQTFSSKYVTIKYCNTPNGTYSNLGNQTSLDANPKTFTETVQPISYNILYLGIQLNLTLAYKSIGNNTPVGPQQFTSSYYNLFPLYKESPTILYGKNFLCMNTSSPISGVSDQILELHAASGRNIIYIGDLVKATLVIGNNGLTIDNFIINCGTWNSN